MPVNATSPVLASKFTTFGVRAMSINVQSPRARGSLKKRQQSCQLMVVVRFPEPNTTRRALLTLLAMLCFAANSLLCRAALAGHHADAASFTLLRIAGELGLIDPAAAQAVGNAYREYRRQQHAKRLNANPLALNERESLEAHIIAVNRLWQAIFSA